jgi:hypothetical protein
MPRAFRDAGSASRHLSWIPVTNLGHQYLELE